MRKTHIHTHTHAYIHKYFSYMDPHIWPSKSRTTSPNLHTAAM